MFINLDPGPLNLPELSFERLLELAKNHGYQGIHCPLGELSQWEDPTVAADQVDDAGLKWGGFNLPIDFRQSEQTYREQLKSLRHQAPLAEELGADRCVTYIMPGHNELDEKANFALHVERLAPAAECLADHNIRFGIEFVGTRTLRDSFKHPFVHDIPGILKLAEAIGSDTGVLLDSFHWHNSAATADDIIEYLPGKVVHVHVNDARADRSREEQIDNERAMAGDTGVIDLPTFFSALRTINYDGPVTQEPFMPELAKQNPDAVLKRNIESIRQAMGS